MSPADVVVLSAARTPIGRYGASFKGVHLDQSITRLPNLSITRCA